MHSNNSLKASTGDYYVDETFVTSSL